MQNYLRGIIPDPNMRRVLLSIIAITAVYGLTIGYLYPLLSLKMEARGFTSVWIGLMGAMPFIASVVVSPLCPLIFKLGSVRKLVFFSILTDLFLILALSLTENIYVWYVCRFLMGFAGTVLFVVTETWINEIAEDRSRGRILGLYTFTLSATFAISPLFIVVFGFEGNLPFLVGAFIIACSLIPIYWTRDSSPDFSGGKLSHVWRLMYLAPTLMAATALMAFDEAAVLTFLPIYGLRQGVTAEISALYLTVIAIGSMAAQPFIGALADKVNRYALIFACAVITLLCSIALPFIIDTKFIVWPVIFIWGAVVAGIYTVALTIMGQRFRGSQLAAGNAAIAMMWGLAGTVAPGSIGFGMKLWDPHGFIVVLVVSAALFLILATVRRVLPAKR